MSSRSTFSTDNKEQIAKAFMRSFIELIENFLDKDSHLEVVFKCITALFDSMNIDDRSLVLKKILMHFLRKFPIEFEDGTEKSDQYIGRTLDLWRIFGKCSKTMGPVAILEKIEDTYVGCWQYYQMLAESLIEEGRTNTDELHKAFKNCMEHCELSNEEVRKIFGPKIMSYVKFPAVVEEDECTIQFMQIRQNDIRKSLAARRRSSLAPHKLHAILEVNDEPTATTMTVNEQTTTTLIRKPPADDFTVFRDPTIIIGQRKSFDANANSPTVCGNHLVPKKIIHAGDPLLTSTPDHLRKPVPTIDFDS